jgi:hypothetical protein
MDQQVSLSDMEKTLSPVSYLHTEPYRPRPAGLEPATYGLEIRLWSRKWLVNKDLYRSF